MHEQHPPRAFCRQVATKLWSVRLQRASSASRGGGSRLIMKMTRIGCTAQRGGFTSAISMALMPSAHTSTCCSRIRGQMLPSMREKMLDRDEGIEISPVKISSLDTTGN